MFDTEWYDQQAEIIRTYRVTFFPGDQTIEMVSPQHIPIFNDEPQHPGNFFSNDFVMMIARHQEQAHLPEALPLLGCTDSRGLLRGCRGHDLWPPA